MIISLYDATPDFLLYGSPHTAKHARALGEALGQYTLLFRIHSPLLSSIATRAHEEGGTIIALSPATGKDEHQRVFRLPDVSFPTIYTGKGALGSDVVLAESAEGICICGSEEEALLGILGCIGPRVVPIGISTQEPEDAVRERITTHYPELMQRVFVSDDPEKIAEYFSTVFRKTKKPL